MPPVSMLLGLLAYAPTAITEITALYNAIKGTFSPSDQATVDKALADAIAADAAATAKANAALDAAAKR
jgi:hypothetical protein